MLRRKVRARRAIAAAAGVAMAVTAGPAPSMGIGWPDAVGYRHLSAVRNLSGMQQDALEIHVHPGAWRGQPLGLQLEGRVELAFGVFRVDGRRAGFASLGPVVQWQRALGVAPLFMELGVSPTVLGETEFKDRTELGSNFHFTSHLAVGMAFGARRQLEVGYRLQHTSNANVDADNPGVDMHGATLRWRFR